MENALFETKDERTIVQELLQNPQSEYWHDCYTFVSNVMHYKARGMSPSDQEDLIQEVMFRMIQYLPGFRFRCSLKSWLTQIISSCIIDRLRKISAQQKYIPLALSEEKDEEEEQRNAIEVMSTEETFERKDKIKDVLNALFEYACTHSDGARNTNIIEHYLRGYSQVETARSVGCDPAVVGYIIRAAQRYARAKVD